MMATVSNPFARKHDGDMARLQPIEDEDVAGDRDWRRRYLDFLDHHPLTSQAVSGMLIGVLGALIGNHLGKCNLSKIRQKQHLQASSAVWMEILAFGCYGAIQGPVGHFWYNWWERNGPESSSKSMLLDQIIVQPPRILLMYVCLDALKGGLQAIGPSIANRFASLGPVVVSSWRYWPVVLYITGKMVQKRKNHVIALKLWSLLWTIYNAKHRRSIEKQP